MRVLIIDNYDSFTYNLYYYFLELGIKPKVITNDFCTDVWQESEFFRSYECLVLSPGFGCPKDSGITLDLIKAYAPEKKILGVCLGHQCLAEVFGGVVSELPEPLHAKTLPCYFVCNRLCKEIQSPFEVALYHSLYVSCLGDCELLGWSFAYGLKIPMIIKHKTYQSYGIQFHLESILQQQGKTLLKNFLKI